MAVCEVLLTDAAIKRALNDEAITELKDPRFPVRLRLNSARTGGSWFLVTYMAGKASWSKLANWPDVPAKTALANIPRQLVAGRRGEEVTLASWQDCGEMLRWYRTRADGDRSLSAKRRANIRSAIDRHLLPMLTGLAIEDLRHATVEERLIWPLQQRYALGTVRQYFAVLKRVTKQATVTKRLGIDPLASLRFTDFIPQTIAAKGSRLQPKDLGALLQSFAKAAMPKRLLVLLMLAMGTRIGETRQLTWAMFDLEGGRLVIPPNLTKTRVEHLLPLSAWLVNILLEYRRWQAAQGKGDNWLFPSDNGKSALNERTASEWVKAISQGRWTAHQLRKLARTCWADLGVDYMVAEQLLNHSMTKLDKAYIHTYMETQKRAAIELWHDSLNSIRESR